MLGNAVKEMKMWDRLKTARKRRSALPAYREEVRRIWFDTYPDQAERSIERALMEARDDVQRANNERQRRTAIRRVLRIEENQEALRRHKHETDHG